MILYWSTTLLWTPSWIYPDTESHSDSFHSHQACIVFLWNETTMVMMLKWQETRCLNFNPETEFEGNWSGFWALLFWVCLLFHWMVCVYRSGGLLEGSPLYCLGCAPGWCWWWKPWAGGFRPEPCTCSLLRSWGKRVLPGESQKVISVQFRLRKDLWAALAYPNI